MLPVIHALYLFFVYAFLGWVVEVAYHVITVGKFINRGFLIGPYCPIYGFGMIFILYLLTPYMSNLFIVFLLSMAITTLIELVAGYLMEKFLHKRWWDYSNMPFNFKGYICLRFSIYWGLGALFVVEIIHPVVDAIYEYMPYIVTEIFVFIMAAMMLTDFIYTVTKILGLNKQLQELDDMEKKIEKISYDIGGKITDGVKKSEEDKKKLHERYEELSAKHDKRLEELSKKHKRLIEAFPDIKDLRNKEVFEKLKNKVHENRSK